MQELIDWLDTRRGRLVGAALVLALAVGGVLTARGAALARPAGAAGDTADIVALEFAGTEQAAASTMQAYSATAVTDALIGDLWFILCWSPLLALLALWAGQNYRTQSTRRLAAPLAITALGGGVLDLLENASIQLAVGGLFGLDRSPEGWRLAASFTWGKWLIVLVVGVFALGGLASAFGRQDIRRVLRAGDTAQPRPASRTMDETGYGLAFSGGGIRAASITLGALQALEYDEPMGWDSADNVASVSGGSYMTGAWSLARTPPAADPAARPPRPWALGRIQPGPEERHLRANLGYLLSNTPRGVGDSSTDESRDRLVAAKAKRRPSAIATVLTGMTINALVMLGMLWSLSQPLGWFYRWYLGLSCGGAWQEAGTTLTAAQSSGCLGSADRLAPPILFWTVLGLAVLMLWVLAAKLTETSSAGVPPALAARPQVPRVRRPRARGNPAVHPGGAPPADPRALGPRRRA